MIELLRGVPPRIWGLLALIVLVPLAVALVVLWAPAARRLGLATRLTSWAVALMGLGFGAMALVATLAVLQTGLQEIRQRHLASIVGLADEVSAAHLRAPDSASFARSLSRFRALQPDAGPATIWGRRCGASCVTVVSEPGQRTAATAWAHRLIAHPPPSAALRTVAFGNEMHLELAGVLRDPGGVPEGYLVVAMRAGWVADRALRTAFVLVVIAYAGLGVVGWLTRGMLAVTVAARVRDIIRRLDHSADTPPRRQRAAGRHDELGLLEAAVSRQIVSSIEQLREADRQATEARALAARMEATTTLAAGVAHDFSNLMSGVMANCELLRADVARDADATRTLETIVDCASRGGLLAQQLVAFARGGTYQPARVHLNTLVGETLQLEAHNVPADVRIALDLAPNLPEIEADPVQLTQVVSNLHRNALEAIAAGTGAGTVWLRTGQTVLQERRDGALANLPPGPYVTLEVEDSGAGMSEETRARIFEPFFTTKPTGRGMGLAATYGIVTHHGGSIAVVTAEGHGTTFIAYFPAAGPAPTAQPADTHPDRRTILLVDDEAAILAATQRLLERQGHRVLTAGSGPEALEVAGRADEPIQVVLLDLRMPGMSGAEAYDQLTAACPGARVILCSGEERDEQTGVLLRRGAAGVLRKPYALEDLQAALARAHVRS